MSSETSIESWIIMDGFRIPLEKGMSVSRYEVAAPSNPILNLYLLRYQEPVSINRLTG